MKENIKSFFWNLQTSIIALDKLNNYVLDDEVNAELNGICEGLDEDLNGKTRLGIAALYGNIDAVKALLALRQIDVNAADASGATALDIAAKAGHLEIVKVLLAHPKIDVNASRNPQTALWYAASEGHYEVVKCLLSQKNIYVGSKSSDHTTPLVEAQLKGHRAIADLLLVEQRKEAFNVVPLIKKVEHIIANPLFNIYLNSLSENKLSIEKCMMVNALISVCAADSSIKIKTQYFATNDNNQIIRKQMSSVIVDSSYFNKKTVEHIQIIAKFFSYIFESTSSEYSLATNNKVNKIDETLLKFADILEKMLANMPTDLDIDYKEFKVILPQYLIELSHELEVTTKDKITAKMKGLVPDDAEKNSRYHGHLLFGSNMASIKLKAVKPLPNAELKLSFK